MPPIHLLIKVKTMHPFQPHLIIVILSISISNTNFNIKIIKIIRVQNSNKYYKETIFMRLKVLLILIKNKTIIIKQ